MTPLMIYILDEKIPYAQLKSQIDLTQPLTKEQIVDLILSKIEGKDVINFNAFKRFFEASSFQLDTNENKLKLYLETLKNLEFRYDLYEKCDNPKELRASLINEEFSYHVEHEKTILYNRQIESWANTAAGWVVLKKKIEYLNLAIKSLTTTHSTSGADKKNIPEKWYALLHCILVDIGKEPNFNDTPDKKYIMKYGKEKYKFKQSGQGFYNELLNLRTPTMDVYIKSMSKKDRTVWKNIIQEISENDADVNLWLKKQVQ